MEKIEISRASELIFGLIKEIDGYIQDYEPFKLVKTDPGKTKAVLWNATFALAVAARMFEPFLPDTAAKVEDILGVAGKESFSWEVFEGKSHDLLFPRLR